MKMSGIYPRVQSTNTIYNDIMSDVIFLLEIINTKT